MKNKIIKSIFMSVVIAGMLIVSSCNDYLNVNNDSTLPPETVFSSVSYCSAAVTGVYNRLMGDNAYGSRVAIILPLSAEDFKATGDYNPTDRRGISSYGVTAAGEDLKDPFNQFYQGIERANICIKYIPASDLYTNGSAVEKATLQRLYGEVLTLRAIFYHELIRNWGDLPAQFEPSMDIKNLYLGKADRDIVYDRLLKDLEEAEALVPWRTESGIPSTRITKGAVKGLRARIALARGGYSLRVDPQQMIRRDDYKDFYKIAYDECLEIIQHREQHDLNPSFENLFRTLHGTRMDPKNELIFEVGAFGGDSKTDSKLGFGNGPRINSASSYGVANGQIAAIPTYFYEFDTFDTRRDVTIAYFDVIDKDDNKELATSIAMRDGKFRKYWTSVKGSSQNLGINWPVLRFADVLLMFAEADNELNGAPSGAAILAFEEVRKRAYVGNVSKIGVTPTDYTGFFNAIVKERLLEFGGEGIRKYDLIRWGILKNKILETRAKLTDFMNGVGQYANVPLNAYTKKSKLKNLTVPEERASFDLYGGALSKVLYIAEPGSVPSDYKKIAWRAAVNDDYINSELKGFASKFQENHSELLPIHNAVLNQNYNLRQDYGY